MKNLEQSASLPMNTVIFVIIIILKCVATWKIFVKMGEPGWKALIPFYNEYTLYKKVWNLGWFVAMLITGCITPVLSALVLFMIFSPPLYITFLLQPQGIILGLAVLALNKLRLAIHFVLTYLLSRSFRHGILFAAGLMLLPGIFLIILAFSSNQFQAPLMQNTEAFSPAGDIGGKLNG